MRWEAIILLHYLRGRFGIDVSEQDETAIQKAVEQAYLQGRFDRASEIAIAEPSPEPLTVELLTKDDNPKH